MLSSQLQPSVKPEKPVSRPLQLPCADLTEKRLRKERMSEARPSVIRATASVLQRSRQRRQAGLQPTSWTQAGPGAAFPCAPLSKLPAEGLEDDVRARYRHGKVVRIQHGEVAKELLHLANQLAHVHLCQVLDAQVLKPVGEDCVARSRRSGPRVAVGTSVAARRAGEVAHRLYSP